MKKLFVFAALAAALAGCQSNSKKNVEMAIEDSFADEPVMEVEEIYAGTLPSADGPGIDYVLTFGAATNGIDTLYTLDVTYLDANGPGKNVTFSNKGKKQQIHKVVDKKPKTAVKLTPDNGEQPIYFVVVNDTTLRLVNDSTLQENVTQAVYDITKVKD